MLRTAAFAAISLCLPVFAEAGICRHMGGWFPASAYSPCPECEAEGKVPPGYKWHNAHLAPSGTAVGKERESGQDGWGPISKTSDTTPVQDARTFQVSNSWRYTPYVQRDYVPYSYPYWPPYTYYRYNYVYPGYANK